MFVVLSTSPSSSRPSSRYNKFIVTHLNVSFGRLGRLRWPLGGRLNDKQTGSCVSCAQETKREHSAALAERREQNDDDDDDESGRQWRLQPARRAKFEPFACFVARKIIIIIIIIIILYSVSTLLNT